MVHAEAKGQTREVFSVQHVEQAYGEAYSATSYYMASVEQFVPEGTILLSSAPPTQAQIELGQRIARKHGLTE